PHDEVRGIERDQVSVRDALQDRRQRRERSREGGVVALVEQSLADRRLRARVGAAVRGAQRHRAPGPRVAAPCDRGAAAEVQAGVSVEPCERHDLSRDRATLRDLGEDGREADQPRARALHEEGRGRGRRYVLEAMEPDSSHQAALDQAARWHARLEAPDCTAEEREAFAAWLGSDTNREAWRRAERICALLASAAASDPRLRAMVDQANARRGGPRAERKRAWWVPASLAAGIAAVALVLGS